MHAAKIVTFIVWGLTAATGVSIAMGVGSKNLQNTPHIPYSDSATYSTAHITQLFTPSAAPATSTHTPSGSSTLQLLGIVYSSDASQSRALLDTAQGSAKAYGVGSILPNGAHITAIAQRSVTLAFNATTQTLELPKK